MKSNYLLKDKRILIVLGCLEMGGSERQALLLSKYLKEREKSYVEIWGLRKPGNLINYCNLEGIKWRYIPFYWNKYPIGIFNNIFRSNYIIKFKILLNKFNPDVIIPFTGLPNVLCGLLWRLTSSKTCIWNQRDEGLHHFGYIYELLAVKLTPVFISNSIGCENYLKSKFKINKNKLHIVHNGVIMKKPLFDRSSWRKKLNINNNSIVVCMISNLHDNKDHYTLIKAWNIVVNKCKLYGIDNILLLPGNKYGNTYDKLNILCKKLKILDYVKFIGSIEDISGIIKASDIGVLSSKSEGCPNGLLECMALGLAVVGTDITGIREIVGNHQLKLLSPIMDYKKLAENIIFLINNKENRIKIGFYNKKRIKKEYNANDMLNKYTDIIKNEIIFNN